MHKDWVTKIFSGIAGVVVAQWRWILAASLALTIAAAVFVPRIGLDTDVMGILPENDPVVKDFLETTRVFGFTEKLVVFLSFAPDIPESGRMPFLDAFTTRLSNDPLVRHTEYKIPVIGFNTDARRIEDKFDLSYQLYASEKDPRRVLMFIYPAGSPGDVTFCEKLLASVKDTAAQARQEAGLREGSVRLQYTGGYAITLFENNNMKKNIRLTLLSSMIGVLILFYLFFRKLSLLFFTGVAMVMSVIWSGAVLYFAIGSLNVMTISFGAIVIGLGIDFAIHVSNSFMHFCAKGNSVEESVRESITSNAKGILFACLTTVAAFYSLMLTGFKGLAEFGFLVGTGLLLCVAAMVFVLPSFFMMFRRLYQGRVTHQNISVFTLTKLGLFVERNGKVLAIAIIVLWAVFLAFSFATRGTVGFDNELESMSSTNNEAIQTQRDILTAFGNAVEPVILVAKNSDSRQAFDMIDQRLVFINEMVESCYALKSESLFTYVPALEGYSGFLSRIPGGNKEKLFDYFIGRLDRDPSKHEEALFLREKKQYLIKLLEQKNRDKYFIMEQVRHLFPEIIFEKFLSQDKATGAYYAAAYVYARERQLSLAQFEWLNDYFNIPADGSMWLSGVSIVSGRLEQLIKKQIKIQVILLSLVSLVLLTILYGRIKLVLISAFALGMGITATAGLMAFTGMKFNYMSTITIPLLIGMGIDNTIYMITKYYGDAKQHIAPVIASTGRAFLLTSLTTINGFSSLMFAKNRGLISLGAAVSIGMVFCLLVALFVVPGLLQMTERKKR